MKRYTSDLSDGEWEILEGLLTRSDPRGAVMKHSKRELIHAVLYVLENGIKWRNLPKEFAPWGTVYDHFRRWNQRGLWSRVLQALQSRHRRSLGRKQSPSLAIIDAQSVKTIHRGEHRGFDGGKKSKDAKGTCSSTCSAI